MFLLPVMQDFKFALRGLVIAVAFSFWHAHATDIGTWAFLTAGKKNLVAAGINRQYFFSIESTVKKSYTERFRLLHQSSWSNAFYEVVCLQLSLALIQRVGKHFSGLFGLNWLWLSYFTIRYFTFNKDCGGFKGSHKTRKIHQISTINCFHHISSRNICSRLNFGYSSYAESWRRVVF